MHHKALHARSHQDDHQQIISRSSAAAALHYFLSIKQHLFCKCENKKVLNVLLMSGWNRRDSGEINGRTQNQDNICPNYQRVWTD